MFRLTREVRFSINDDAGLPPAAPTNNFAGFPSLAGLGRYFALQVTLAGEPKAGVGYVRNIKEIDAAVRATAIPLVAQAVHRRQNGVRDAGGTLLLELFDALKSAWPGNSLRQLRLALTPFLSLAVSAREHPMIQLSQKFEFSASHRLHNPELSDEENRRLFGKCNNPLGHGHNYILEVTLTGKPDANGLLIEIPRFERIVAQAVIEPFDHRNLNLEIAPFSTVIPTVENLAMVIFQILKPKFTETAAKLAKVTVWETPKTWCEYEE